MSTGPGFWSSIKGHWQIARQLRHLKIHFDPEKCSGIWECFEVCPVDCWSPDLHQHVVIFHDPDRCIACGACVLQCPEKAIELR